MKEAIIMKKQILLKYDQDDILEIITEYMAEKHGLGEFYARAMLFGTPDKDLRVVAVVGDSEDNSVKDVDLNKVDEELDYNGGHAHVTYIDPATFTKRNFDKL